MYFAGDTIVLCAIIPLSYETELLLFVLDKKYICFFTLSIHFCLTSKVYTITNTLWQTEVAFPAISYSKPCKINK